jgi:hypothetical protein
LGRLGALRIPVGYRIVFPFTALCLLLGIFVSVVASQQFGSAAAVRLDRQAMREQYAVGAAFASFEQRRLTVLRMLSSTDGTAQAVERQDAGALKTKLYPIVANQLPVVLTVSVVSTGGRELLRLTPDLEQPAHCFCSSGGDVADLPHVGQVLTGLQDSRGPKYADAARIDGAWYAYTVGPVTEGERVVGAVVVAERLQALVQEAHADSGVELAVFSADGQMMAVSDAGCRREAAGCFRWRPARPGGSGPAVLHALDLARRGGRLRRGAGP